MAPVRALLCPPVRSYMVFTYGPAVRGSFEGGLALGTFCALALGARGTERALCVLDPFVAYACVNVRQHVTGTRSERVPAFAASIPTVEDMVEALRVCDLVLGVCGRESFLLYAVNPAGVLAVAEALRAQGRSL